MPEGPEVRIIANYIRNKCLGKTITSIEVVEGCPLFTPRKQGRIPPDLNQIRSVLPLRVRGVWSSGKVIFIELTGGMFLTSQLLMTGKWIYEDFKERMDPVLKHPHVDTANSAHTSMCLNFGSFQNGFEVVDSCLWYNDKRHQGLLGFHLNLESMTKLESSHNGCLLQTALSLKGHSHQEENKREIVKTISLEGWIQILRNSRRKDVLIGKALTNQAYFGGIGNYLRAEILYQAQISPLRSLSSLSIQELTLLYQTSLELIYVSYLMRGLTISDFWDPEGGKGRFEPKVYGRKTDPCGRQVVKQKLGSESQNIHWVPTYQK